MSAEVYELVLNGPGKNALGSDVMQAIVHGVRAADGRPILVTGTGDAFSAGLNLKEVAALDRPGMERFLLLLDEVMDTLYGYPGPTVAAVNGHAIAGGCVIALCCDLRIATNDPRARIGLNEVARGLEFPPKILALTRQRSTPPRSGSCGPERSTSRMTSAGTSASSSCRPGARRKRRRSCAGRS